MVQLDFRLVDTDIRLVTGATGKKEDVLAPYGLFYDHFHFTIRKHIRSQKSDAVYGISKWAELGKLRYLTYNLARVRHHGPCSGNDKIFHTGTF
jgi:hypothetical protein